MSLDAILSTANIVAMVGWLLLIFLPRQAFARLIAGAAIPLLLAVAYLVLIATYMPGAEGGFSSLTEVTKLFAQPGLLVAGWLHYLAFDLFIGAWETRDAAAHGIPHLLVVPCLLLTFMFGPIGLLSYFAIRTWRLRRLELR